MICLFSAETCAFFELLLPSFEPLQYHTFTLTYLLSVQPDAAFEKETNIRPCHIPPLLWVIFREGVFPPAPGGKKLAKKHEQNQQAEHLAFSVASYATTLGPQEPCLFAQCQLRFRNS